MTALPPNIVRAYDIRGLAPGQIDPDTARRIGYGFGCWLRQQGADSAAVGHDARATSSDLYDAASDGLRHAAIRVVAGGLAPTPVVGWTVDDRNLGGGLVVTASHNPQRFNGFKMVGPQAAPLLPDDIAAVARLADATPAPHIAAPREAADLIAPYLEMLAQRFDADTQPLSGLRIAVDPGNGVAALTGPAALSACGATVHALYDTVRTGAPNHDADPQDPDTMRDLARCVRTLQLDFGVAWDGDGDRIGVVDQHGRRPEADWIAAVLARPLLARSPGAAVLLDYKTSTSVIEDVASHGGRPQLARTGYSFFRRQMRDDGIAFGGETSGHLMFGPRYLADEHHPWLDDGVYAALALATWLRTSDTSLADAFADVRPRPISPELRLDCPDHRKAQIADLIGDRFADTYPVDRADGARIAFANGWAHARASNTAPALSLRFEADSDTAYTEIAEQLSDALSVFPEIEGINQLSRPPLVGPQRLD